ncbi:c-type cytochrome biogenesis protein CcmI [Brevirhabdus pacifica]|uniref:C-type cytochrome biogenesis protein CcmI n=2 Tax=Brevirhabdus pacifica TaxID=1267768 RepID=A0A1U7DE99_9RHOB|nr:c-type cytochrome biogenesis protein CcmI [Brevirhabdus pacifica]APX88340.1 c-type cytochrome biogenesis protein CcmI [Brevirhabdus pacifica]PJJ87209.1 cytochrome c-type biogenesis protein CcmH [Brevirhabdus pacifica]
MLFWVLTATISLLITAILVRTLLRPRQVQIAELNDLQVYRDQMKELERDLARGVITADDADRARLEISRRILEADRAVTRAGAVAETHSRPGVKAAAAAFMAVLIVVGAAALYTRLGAPGYPDMPLATRLANLQEAARNRPSQAEAEAVIPPAEEPQDVDPAYLQLVERLRGMLKQRTGDARGYDLLARSEANLGQFSAAAVAKARAIEMKGEEASSADYADLADMRILAAGGYVSPEAEEALRRALELDSRNGPALYYSGLMFSQLGRPDLGFQIWRRQLKAGPEDAPWMSPIREQIEEVARLAGEKFSLAPRSGGPLSTPLPNAGADAGATLPGPDQAAIAAAGEMSAEDRNAMIEGMVGQLSERLAAEGGTPAEWARLIRALGVLGQKDRAAAIWSEASQTFAGDETALAQIRPAAEAAGVAR